jgi:TAG lipase/lysophosphatidylethanolamine acyltransferase
LKLQRFFRWLTRKKPVEVWFEILRNAKSYEEWEEAAFQLDVLLGNDLWYADMLLVTG